METTTPATEPPIASQQALDFREPWEASAEYVYGRDDKEVHLYPHRLRIAQCVNACTGMADPAKEIQALRDKLDDKTVMHLPLLEKLAAAEKRIRDLHETIQGIESDARDLRKFKKFPESVESLACSILLKLKSTTP